MFTGLIQKTGVVKRVSRGAGLVIEIAAESPWPTPLVPGESIAVNGACLTAVRCDGARFTADVLRETESRTGLGEVAPGTRVNLERAVRAGEPLGGHIVQGHVDAAARLRSLRRLPDGDVEFAVELPPELAPEIALKGSIAVDGVSLTVAAVEKDFFAVRLIPQTLSVTALKERKAGDLINLETDVIAKYLRRQLSLLMPEKSRRPTWNDLREAGIL